MVKFLRYFQIESLSMNFLFYILVLLFCLISPFSYAGGTIGSCEYGVDGDTMYIRGGSYITSKDDAIRSIDAYKCGEGIGLAVMKANMLFEQVGAFVIITPNSSAKCFLREAYIKQDNKWVTDSTMEYVAKAQMSNFCN